MAYYRLVVGAAALLCLLLPVNCFGDADNGAADSNQAAAAKLNRLLEQMPRTTDVQVLNNSPQAATALILIRAEAALANAVLQRLNAAEAWEESSLSLFWLAAKLLQYPAPEVTSKLKSSDPRLQALVLDFFLPLQLAPKPEEWYAALRSSDSNIAARAVLLAQQSRLENEFFLEAFKSPHDALVRAALAVPDVVAGDQLYPLVLREVSGQKTEDDGRRPNELLHFLLRYNRVPHDCCLAIGLDREKALHLFEQMQGIRSRVKQPADGQQERPPEQTPQPDASAGPKRPTEPVSEATAARLDELLAGMSNIASWKAFNESPEALAILGRIRADSNLTKAALQRLAAYDKYDDGILPLVRLAPRLEGGQAVITSKLKSKDLEIQATILIAVFLERLKPTLDEWLAVLDNTDKYVLRAAVNYARKSELSDARFYLKAFNMPDATLKIRTVEGRCWTEREAALFQAVIVEVDQLKTDEQVREARHLFEFLNRYNQVHLMPASLDECNEAILIHIDLELLRLRTSIAKE